MEKREIDKFFKTKKSIGLIGLIGIIIAITLFIIGIEIDTKEINDEAISYHDLIADNKDKEDSYAKVNIVYISMFATNTEYNTNYYYIMDENNYSYIARITDETFDKIKETYESDPDNFTYEMKGYLINIKDEIKDLAISEYSEHFENSDVILTDNNYENYFGSTYIDETITPNTDVVAILYGSGVGLIILSMVFIILFIIDSIKVKRSIGKNNIDIVKSDMMRSSTIYFKKQKICLTDKYLVSIASGLIIINYEDIIWIYNQKLNQYALTININLLAYTKDKKKHVIANVMNDEDKLTLIINELYKRNDKILVGYTKENQTKYKEIKKGL